MASSTFSQPNAKTFTPEEIVSEVLAGRVRVPSFQRQFKCQWKDVKLLFDIIAKGYPIGNLLLWERQADEGRIQLGALDIDAPKGIALYVVDGQQRVTSLTNALTVEAGDDPRFSLVFNLDNEEFQKPEPGDPPHLIPLPVIFDLQKLLAWFAERPPQKKDWFERATRLAKTIRQYAIPAYIVKQQDETVLRDIFDRMNNYGKRLSRAEVFTALHGGIAQDGSNLHFSDIADAVDDETRFGRLDDDTVLNAVLARRSEYVTRDIRGEFKEDDARRDFAGEGAAAAYHAGQRALVNAIKFAQSDAGVPHIGFLPYRYLVIVLTRFFAFYPNPSRRNRTLLRRFFWRAALVGPNVFRGISFAMQTLAGCIERGDESRAVQQLLGALKPHTPVLPRLDHFHSNAAESRVVLCALWSLAPMSPIDGTIYDQDAIGATLLNETTAANSIKIFAPRAPENVRRWVANRAILLGEVDEVANDATVAFLENVEQFDGRMRTRILKSHAMDKAIFELLKERRVEDFLAARQERLKEVLRDFLESMTETKFEDTPPLDAFDLDTERDDEAHA